MASLSDTAVDSLRKSFGGELLVPGDAGYDEARSLWNGDIDRRPALIAQRAERRQTSPPRSASPARNELEIAVRGGGHSFAGHGVVDDGLMIDLSTMRDVTVDAGARRVRCGGGTTWAELDAATQEHGLAVPGGVISHTGVAGLTLGGGIGWLSHKHGLSCDNLVSARVVTADGSVVTASATENADLHWALRGGGGNFGVVTEFEFALHPVGPLVNLALFFWSIESGADALAPHADDHRRPAGTARARRSSGSTRRPRRSCPRSSTSPRVTCSRWSAGTHPKSTRRCSPPIRERLAAGVRVRDADPVRRCSSRCSTTARRGAFSPTRRRATSTSSPTTRSTSSPTSCRGRRRR